MAARARAAHRHTRGWRWLRSFGLSPSSFILIENFRADEILQSVLNAKCLGSRSEGRASTFLHGRSTARQIPTSRTDDPKRSRTSALPREANLANVRRSALKELSLYRDCRRRVTCQMRADQLYALTAPIRLSNCFSRCCSSSAAESPPPPPEGPDSCTRAFGRENA